MAPFATTLILTAAYLYVVLSGTQTRIAAIGVICTAAASPDTPPKNASEFATQCQEQYSTIQSAAGMFAIGGSYLALGAIALVFTLTLVVEEHHPRSKHPTVRDATLFFYCAATLISVLAVTWGYRDAVWVLQKND